MKKSLIRVTSIVLVVTMIASSMFMLSGCGKEEVVEEDTHTIISVTSEELAPEITDEDLGITRKDIKELSKIVGYQSWEGYNFLIFRNEGGEGNVTTTVQIEDKDLFDALYNARLYVYTDVSYASVSQDDPMYMAYAKGLRSLGSDFYDLAKDENDLILGEGEVNTDEVVSDKTDNADAVPSSDSDQNEEATNPEDSSSTDEASATEEDSSDVVVEDTATDSDNTSADAEATSEATDIDLGDTIETMTNEEFENGGWQDTEASIKAEEANNKLQEAIEAYMSSVSLNRATQVLVFALDGELLGEMTSAKLNDYVAAFEIVPIPYTSTEQGVAYISDMEDGITYKVDGNEVDESGTLEYTIKNDTKKPVVVYVTSETTQDSAVIFENYMQTKKSQGWYLVENQYEFSSSDSSYNIRVEHKNSDADLAASLPEGQVLRISELEKSVQRVPSIYSAIVNDTDETLYVVADTGDTAEIGSKMAIGVHRSAYGELNYYFEGADGVDELLGN